MTPAEQIRKASDQYRPHPLRLLFVAEAPPAFKTHRMFYFTGLKNGDTLFIEMMKVLYPEMVGFANGAFGPEFSVKQIRQNKAELLKRFRSEGNYLVDACEKPMPDRADSTAKTRIMKLALPRLRTRISALMVRQSVPIVLIGNVTYGVCADILRDDGRNVLNTTMINHPARGGQILFRSKLSAVMRRLRRSTPSKL